MSRQLWISRVISRRAAHAGRAADLFAPIFLFFNFVFLYCFILFHFIPISEIVEKKKEKKHVSIMKYTVLYRHGLNLLCTHFDV